MDRGQASNSRTHASGPETGDTANNVDASPLSNPATPSNLPDYEFNKDIMGVLRLSYDHASKALKLYDRGSLDDADRPLLREVKRRITRRIMRATAKGKIQVHRGYDPDCKGGGSRPHRRHRNMEYKYDGGSDDDENEQMMYEADGMQFSLYMLQRYLSRVKKDKSDKEEERRRERRARRNAGLGLVGLPRLHHG